MEEGELVFMGMQWETKGRGGQRGRGGGESGHSLLESLLGGEDKEGAEKCQNLSSWSSSNSPGQIPWKAKGATAHRAGIGNPCEAEQHLASCVSHLSRPLQNRNNCCLCWKLFSFKKTDHRETSVYGSTSQSILGKLMQFCNGMCFPDTS
ncbi:hypothetical protein EYF80_033506 [Liparis tanakae]|uniref:Uncharacterized protein n=1 Tax=Liparis tanakae TaxID=230148 RepID=A0A4Z2GST8_9TELE|nr:hypothetical protein EYF80_033506 [Liparis tanakae]